MLGFRIDSTLLGTKELNDGIDILFGNRLLFEDSFECICEILRQERLGRISSTAQEIIDTVVEG